MSVTVERDGGAVVVKIPMAIKRRLGRKEVIVPAGLGEAPIATAQEPLVTALARAFLWQELLDDGKYQSIGTLAEALGVDRRYVARILSLALLAPDIIEKIVRGDEPGGLSLERLVKGMPVLWADQRKAIERRE